MPFIKDLKLLLSFIFLLQALYLTAQDTLPKAKDQGGKEVQVIGVRPKQPVVMQSASNEADTSSRKLTVEKTRFAIAPDKMPEYKGGEVGLYNFIKDYMIYPAEAKAMNIEGIVIVKFTIESDGRVTSPEIIMDKVGHGATEEVFRLISLMPRWVPGSLEGMPVPVDYTMPVSFKIK